MSSLLITGATVYTVVEVTFSDGSKATFRKDHNTKEWSYVEGSARDEMNNTIPSSPPSDGSTVYYNITGPNNLELLNWLDSLGMELNLNSNGSMLACTTHGGETICEVVDG